MYTHGHHPAVLNAHARRGVMDSARYLLPALRSTDRLLDVGCGPGSISTELAQRVGYVVGVDSAATAVESARELAREREVDNVDFTLADVHRLPFDAASFDVVHAHQVMQHLPDPVGALRELRRVCRPGGTVAFRDADYAAMSWYPASPLLDRWLALYHDVARANGGEPDAGRHLRSWACEAGLRDVEVSASTWCYATAELRAWWAGSWAERVRRSRFAETAVRRGLATERELEDIAAAWGDWAAEPDSWFVVVNCEVLARP